MNGTYKLLNAFEGLFKGKIFNHRVSTQGDYVAIQFYEDLYNLGRSPKFVQRVNNGMAVVNVANRRQGVQARRGDGSFGEILPHISAIADPGYAVKRGPIATIEIGIEVKIVQKAMIRQIDRVINDLRGQVHQFKSKSGTPITVGIVGVNKAKQYVSFEGPNRSYPTTGFGKHKHPYQEADEAIKRLNALAAPAFDEFLVLEFDATNMAPYPFSWVNPKKTYADYGAVLVRVSNRY